MAAPRDVGPLVAAFRRFLLGRQHVNNLRFQDKLAPRPGPEANLPEGVSHKLANNYYYTRDARREVAPPTLLADGTKAQKVIEAGDGGAQAPVKKTKVPGRLYNYSQSF